MSFSDLECGTIQPAVITSPLPSKLLHCRVAILYSILESAPDLPVDGDMEEKKEWVWEFTLHSKSIATDGINGHLLDIEDADIRESFALALADAKLDRSTELDLLHEFDRAVSYYM